MVKAYFKNQHSHNSKGFELQVKGQYPRRRVIQKEQTEEGYQDGHYCCKISRTKGRAGKEIYGEVEEIANLLSTTNIVTVP
jgi:hypothetical protein